MAGERILPGGSVIEGFWTPGSDGWEVKMGDNLRKIAAGLPSVLVVKSQTVTLPGSPILGDIYIVQDGDANEKDIAVWDGPPASEVWNYYPAFEGLKAYPLDTKLEIGFDGTNWTRGSPVLIGTIDFSVNNVTSTEDPARQISGFAGYKHVYGVMTGLGGSIPIRMGLLKPGQTLSEVSILDGMFEHNGSSRYGLLNFTYMIMMHLSGGVNGGHFEIHNHWNSIVPTKLESHSYDDDASGNDSVSNSSMVTNTTDIFDGVSFFTTAGIVTQGIVKLYGTD